MAALDRPWGRSYPIEMLRLRRGAALLLLALLGLGFAASAGATLVASAGCCGMDATDAAAEPAAPCASLAPASCCEERVPGAAAQPEPTRTLGLAFALPHDLAPARAAAVHAPAPPQPRPRALASVVLRL